MGDIKINCCKTIALLSSAATFRRSPAVLNSVKYPSSLVLGFPAYDGLTARSNNIKINHPVVKIKEEGDEEVSSIMLGNVEIVGPKKEVEALVARVVRYRRDRKIIKYGQLTLVCTLFLIYMLKSNFGGVNRSWKSLLTTGSGLNHLVFLVTFSVAISKPIAGKINERLKVIIQQEKMKLENQGTNRILRALLQKEEVNPEEMKLLIEACKKFSDTDIGTKRSLKALLQKDEVNPEQRKLLNIAYNKFIETDIGETENGQHMRQD